MITAMHLKYKHGDMTIAKYRKIFPNSPLVSKEFIQNCKTPARIIYTITCPNCGEIKTFEKQNPSSYTKKFCCRNCASSYLNRQTWADPEVRKNRTEGISKQHRTEEYRQNAQASWTEKRKAEASQRAKDTLNQKIHKAGSIEKMRETKRDENHRELARQQAFERWADPEFKTKRLEQIQEMIQSPEFKIIREKISKKAKVRWNDPIRGLEWALSQRRKPTKPELILSEFLQNNGYGDYKYTGDGKVLVGRKNPDFISQDRQMIIELFGSYWHSENEIELRKEYFANLGFKTLIIWDYELDNEDTLLTKLKEFHSGLEVD